MNRDIDKKGFIMKQIYKKGSAILAAVLLAVAVVGCHASYSGSINSAASTFLIK
ncbi:MAG: hypothetical protein K2X37_12575 [Chitinophagaceae bacterium]|nr:hypothetical protein [Chitinophagaceae bacterium]